VHYEKAGTAEALRFVLEVPDLIEVCGFSGLKDLVADETAEY